MLTIIDRDRVAITIAICIDSTLHNSAHGRRSVHRVSTQGNEKEGVMVEHLWAHTQDTMIRLDIIATCTTLLC